MMHSELLKRLRGTKRHTFAIWFQAADVIESQAKELSITNASIAELEKERAAAREEIGQLHTIINHARQMEEIDNRQIAAQQLVIEQKDKAMSAFVKHFPDALSLKEALAIQPSTSDLDAYVAEKVKEAEFEFNQCSSLLDDAHRSMEKLEEQRDLAVSALQFYMDHGICEVTYYNVRDALATIKESET